MEQFTEVIKLAAAILALATALLKFLSEAGGSDDPKDKKGRDAR